MLLARGDWGEELQENEIGGLFLIYKQDKIDKRIGQFEQNPLFMAQFYGLQLDLRTFYYTHMLCVIAIDMLAQKLFLKVVGKPIKVSEKLFGKLESTNQTAFLI